MEITANLVKELRQRTGAGMMDCKKALVSTDGNLDKAVDYLREKGLAAAAKKSGRIAAEGAVVAAVAADGKSGCLVEVNSETDFVAKNEDFQEFATAVAEHILRNAPSDVDALLGQTMADGTSLADRLTERIATIGENLAIRRFVRFEAAHVACYIHMGGKIGVLVALDGEGAANATVLGRDVAMHVAAARPLYLQRSEVPAADIDHERGIFRAQALESGKPEAVVDKIVTGRLEKFFAETCLLEQPFVKDTDIAVHKLLTDSAKQLGGNVIISRYARFELGEGLEKRSEDFAAEVAAQLKG
jgi:elongation factor Ts